MNYLFSLRGIQPTLIKFNPEDCPFENFKMGMHNGEPEWCVKVLPPNSTRWFELFCKKNDFIIIMEFFDRNNNFVNYTVTSLSPEVTSRYVDCFDEDNQEHVSLEEAFMVREEVEPSSQELRDIEENELEELLRKSATLTLEDLLDDED